MAVVHLGELVTALWYCACWLTVMAHWGTWWHWAIVNKICVTCVFSCCDESKMSVMKWVNLTNLWLLLTAHTSGSIHSVTVETFLTQKNCTKWIPTSSSQLVLTSDLISASDRLVKKIQHFFSQEWLILLTGNKKHYHNLSVDFVEQPKKID